MIGIAEKLDKVIHAYPLATIELMSLEDYLEHDDWGLVFDEVFTSCQEDLILKHADLEGLARLGTYFEEDQTLWERIRRM